MRFKPSAGYRDHVAAMDRVPSDVDVVGLHPRKRGPEHVWVVSGKAWQGGFRADHKLRQLLGTAAQGKRETWKYFRELWVPKWSEAFRETVFESTGSRKFRYWFAVTKLIGDPEGWSRDKTITKNT